MKKTGIFIDLDGTLIDSKKQISEFDKSVIFKLSEMGVKTYLVTGKSQSNALSYYNELKLDTILVTSSGQVITNPSNKNFEDITSTTSFNEVQPLYNHLRKNFEIKNIAIETLDGKTYFSQENYSNLSHILSPTNPVLQNDLFEVKNIINTYIEISKEDSSEILNNLKQLNKKYLNSFEVAYWDTDDNLPILNIKLSSIDKGEALKKIMFIDSLEYSISFGNGWTDRNMLSLADEGYAMINSVDKIKEFSKFITKYSNNESGVGKELVRIFNLK